MKTVIFVFLLLFVSIIVQTTSSSHIDKEELFVKILNELETKYCPMRGFDGELYCPQVKSMTFNSTYIAERDNPKIIFDDTPFINTRRKSVKQQEYVPRKDPWFGTGFGFDRITRQLKFPVLPSLPPYKTERYHDDPKRFGNVRELLDYMYAERTQYEAGFYTMDEQFMRNIALKFGDYRLHVTVTQKYFITHDGHLAHVTPIDEFKQAIASLPPYNPNDPTSKQWYRMVIDYWGTDVAVSSEHGGAIYQQNILKSCYGGSVTEDLLRDIDAAIKKVPPGELAYLKYRQLGVFNARGGNPEYGMDRINERIASFAQAPAPLRFNAVPLWRHVGYDQTRMQWLRQAIEDYINENTPNIDQIFHEVEQSKAQTYLAHQTVYSFSINVEQTQPNILVWTGCPLIRDRGGRITYCPHCTLAGPAPSLKNGDLYHLFEFLGISYSAQRDEASGYARIVAFNNNGPIHHSPFVRTGCTTAPQFGAIPGRAYDVPRRLQRAICIDCMPIYEQQPAQHGMVHTFLNCVCPTF